MFFQYFNINRTINETSCQGKTFCTFEYFVAKNEGILKANNELHFYIIIPKIKNL